jgi:hypothetical protein
MLLYIIIMASLYLTVRDGWPLYIIVSFDYAIDLVFRNSLIAFFAEAGAAKRNMLRSLWVGSLLGIYYGLVTITTAALYTTGFKDAALVVFISARCLYTIGGAVLFLLPKRLFYRRAAFQALLLISVIENCCAIWYAFINRYGTDYNYCLIQWSNIIISGLLGPLITLYSLNLDSKVRSLCHLHVEVACVLFISIFFKTLLLLLFSAVLARSVGRRVQSYERHERNLAC